MGRLSGRCSVCASAQVDGIEAALAGGASIRAVARKFGVPRSTLGRHVAHSGSAIPGVAIGRDQFEEATKLLSRATTPRERLRGLEAVRAAMRLELRDFARARSAIRAPDEEQLRRLERNLSEAWVAFESVAGGSLDVAHRALQGVREARRTLKEATSRRVDDPVQVTLARHDGLPITTWTASAERVLHGIPKEYRNCDYRIRAQMHYSGEPDVTVHDRDGKLVWRKAIAPGLPRPRRALPHELPPESGNGHDRPRGIGPEWPSR